MEEGFDWSRNPRPEGEGQDLEVLDLGVVPDLGLDLGADLEAAVTRAEDPNPGAGLDPILLRIDPAPKAEAQEDLVRGLLEIAMMMRARMEIAILAKGLVNRGHVPDPVLVPDLVPDLLEVTRTKETKITTKQMRNNRQRSIHEYFLWQFTLNNEHF